MLTGAIAKTEWSVTMPCSIWVLGPIWPCYFFWEAKWRCTYDQSMFQWDFCPREIDYGLVNGEHLWSVLGSHLSSNSAYAYLTDLLGILADTRVCNRCDTITWQKKGQKDLRGMCLLVLKLITHTVHYIIALIWLQFFITYRADTLLAFSWWKQWWQQICFFLKCQVFGKVIYKVNKVYKYKGYLEYFVYWQLELAGQLELAKFTHLYGPDNTVGGQLDLARLLSIISLLLTNSDSFHLQTMRGQPITCAKLWKPMSTVHIEKVVCQLAISQKVDHLPFISHCTEAVFGWLLVGWLTRHIADSQVLNGLI